MTAPCLPLWAAVRTFAEDDSGAIGPLLRDEGKSRRKPWRFCAPGQSQPPALRAVSGNRG